MYKLRVRIAGILLAGVCVLGLVGDGMNASAASSKLTNDIIKQKEEQIKQAEKEKQDIKSSISDRMSRSYKCKRIEVKVPKMREFR